MTGANILLVEDDSTTRRVVTSMTEKLGHHVQPTASSEEALALFSPGQFDLVISDVVLPGMDGIDMIRCFGDIDSRVVPVVMTTLTDQETAIRALEAGVLDFLKKPFGSDRLEAGLSKALEKRTEATEQQLLIGDLIRTRADLQEVIGQRDRFLYHLLDAAPFGIISANTDGRILTFNRTAEEIYDYPSKDVVGKPVSRLFSDDCSWSPGVRKADNVNSSGDAFPVRLHSQEIRDRQGRDIAHMYVVEDLREHEQMESQLLYAERLSLLGQLAPRIAHEFKTPLQVISGHAELAAEWLELGKVEEAQGSLGYILPATGKVLDLVHEMSRLGKPAETRQVELDMREELGKTLEPLKHLGAIRYCKVVEDYDDDLPGVVGDPEQMEQVFRNLIVNAAHAMEHTKGGVLTLRIRQADEGCRVNVTVEDTGTGIPKEELDQVFQPFYTTKQEGKGTGLGLPIARTIVDRHNGIIDVDSVVGEGTRITVSFPSLERE